VSFTSLNPYRLKVTGRVQQFINTFGEEVMVENTDKALAMTCQQFGVFAIEYTVAPKFLAHNQKGAHEWIIEFENPPSNVEHFSVSLDKNLQTINSDYEAKRFSNLALTPLILHSVNKGTFHQWMRSKMKFGNQNKVPRLSENRIVLEEILSFFK
ncbi:MAG: GH3 auxin-responsive promoter family protein, partial [Bacteroidota bacterium]